MSRRIENMQQAVEAMHKCKATHEQSIPLVKKSGEEILWEGTVEVFTLKHSKAKRCYAWGYIDGDEHLYVAYLELPPIDSPDAAVRAFIASEKQKQ